MDIPIEAINITRLLYAILPAGFEITFVNIAPGSVHLGILYQFSHIAIPDEKYADKIRDNYINLIKELCSYAHPERILTEENIHMFHYPWDDLNLYEGFNPNAQAQVLVAHISLSCNTGEIGLFFLIIFFSREPFIDAFFLKTI